MYQMVSNVSKSFIVHQVYQDPKGYHEVSNVYQAYQGVLGISRDIRYIKCILVTMAIVTFYILYMWARLYFCHFANNKFVCVMDLIVITYFTFFFWKHSLVYINSRNKKDQEILKDFIILF